MELKVLNPYKELFQSKTRYILLYGGRAGGRSYAVSQKVVLDTIANKYSRIAAMRYVLGDVRHSVWQEIKDRIEEYSLPEVISDQAMHYEYSGNSIDGKGFKKSSSQNVAKLKSLAGYNLVWIEEADEVAEIDFNHLDSSIRTSKAPNTIILSFNLPFKDHWIIKRWFNLVESEHEGYYTAIPKQEKKESTTYIFTDYKQNLINLPASAINTFESFESHDPEYYYTMIKGLVSEGKTGRVFKNWQPISTKEYEDLPFPKYYGLDFGFSNDPTALVEMKHHNNNIYLRELIYDVNLTNQDISDKLRALEVDGQIIADSAEPKSIEELKRLGWRVSPSVKGPDSIRAGINLLNEHQIYYTDNSTNLIAETQNYVYNLNRDKSLTNKPIDAYNHILDATRYVASYKIKKKKPMELTWI